MWFPGQDCRLQGGELTEDRRAPAPDVVVAGLGSEQGAHRLPERAHQVSEPGRGNPVDVVPPSPVDDQLVEHGYRVHRQPAKKGSVHGKLDRRVALLASMWGSLQPQCGQPSLNFSQIQSGLPLDAPKRAPGGRPKLGGSEWLVRLVLERQSRLEEVGPALPRSSSDLPYMRVDFIAGDPRRLRPSVGALPFLRRE